MNLCNFLPVSTICIDLHIHPAIGWGMNFGISFKKYSLPLEGREMTVIWSHLQCCLGKLAPTGFSVPIKIRNLKKIVKTEGWVSEPKHDCVGIDIGQWLKI